MPMEWKSARPSDGRRLPIETFAKPPSPVDGRLPMYVVHFSTFDELSRYAAAWDRLAGGIPFRRYDWASTWWKHYGAGSLFVLAVFSDGGTLIGLAPWYLRGSAADGRVVRFLGSGEVCSDHLSVLCWPGSEGSVVDALAARLTEGEDARGGKPWDLIELDGVDRDDPVVSRLQSALADRGCPVHRTASANCWRIELPPTWDDYLALLSKDFRKKLRRMVRRNVDTGRAVLHTVGRREELAQARAILVDLHQRRRRALGQPGAFASARFDAFHGEVMGRLLAAGCLRLHWLEWEGRPVAAEYDLAEAGVVYAYQSGIDPQASSLQPGTLATLLTVRAAIGEGFRTLDFLRGDEPYKAHWRARPHPADVVRIVANRAAARARHRLWLAGSKLKSLVKETLGRSATGGGKSPPGADHSSHSSEG